MMRTPPSPTMSALVVDPDIATQQQITNCLRGRYRILTAGRLADALQVLAQERPQVLVLELNQPDGDGIQLIERLRANPATRRMIIVCLTTRKGTRDKVLGFQAGADDYVIKPADSDSFLTRLALLARLRQLLV